MGKDFKIVGDKDMSGWCIVLKVKSTLVRLSDERQIFLARNLKNV